VGSRFDGKVAVVTGAGQGIGEAYAGALAAEGAAVVVADLNEEQANRVAAELTEKGARALAVKVDVADEASANALAEATTEAFGGIDLLVNNAAIYGGMKIEALTSVDLDYYRRIIDVNMNGALVMTRACWRSMRSRGGGAIVNQSSTAAWMAGGYYSIAKAGLNSVTACLAAELAFHNIRVNAIAPGPTDTNATRTVVPDGFLEPLVQSLAIKRLGTPDDLVGALLFLLSDDARWMTGHVIPVDGGQVVRI
jgi:NAD(P)-dependent dehydrogenase (short-subunit alcohol dehydrogenase family)